MFKEIFFGAEKNFSRKLILFHAGVLLTSVLFLYFFSYSTSPRYLIFGDDSAVFQVVGKCWLEGLLPYKDFFDHKGALIYLINALGYAIYPRCGIMLLQIPFMYFSFLFMWRTVELYWSRRATFIIWLFMVFWRASIFYDGNRTEEYSMPFLLAATYFFLRWLKEEKNFLPMLIGFVYGLGFGACVLLRTTNGLPICCYVLLTTIFLIKAGAFKNIWQNFFSFCAGFVLICLPFGIYFTAHGAFYDMIYGTILINTNYATSYNLTRQEFLEIIAPYIIGRCNMLFWLIAASILALVLNYKSKLAWSGLFTGATMLILFMKSRPFLGYSELIAGVLPLLFAVIYELKTILSPKLKKIWSGRAFSLKRFFCKLAFLTMLIMAIFDMRLIVNTFIGTISDKSSAKTAEYYQKRKTELNEFAKIIPAEERSSVVMWGESTPLACFILESGIKPRCRFFGNIQTYFGKFDPAVIDEWVQNVCNDYPKWIVYSALRKEYSGEKMHYFEHNFRRQRNPRVEKILAEKYNLVNETEIYGQIIKLYRLNETM